MNEKAKLQLGETTYELPVLTGTEGNRALDISRLFAETGLITLDDSFANTGGTSSSICYIDGANGVLRYRGIRPTRSPSDATSPRRPIY